MNANSMALVMACLVLGLVAIVAATTSDPNSLIVLNGTESLRSGVRGYSRVIAVTNTTLVTKVIQANKALDNLPTPQIKAFQTTCVTTKVPFTVSCTTLPGASGKTVLQSGAGYSCSTGYKSTTDCRAGFGDEVTPGFAGSTVTYTDTITTKGIVVTLLQTNYQQASVTGNPASLDDIEIVLDAQLRDNIVALVEQQCLQHGFFTHGNKDKRQERFLTCDPAMDLPAPVQMQLQAEISKSMQGGFMIPAAYIQYWLSQEVTRQQLNIAIWSLAGIATLQAIRELSGGFENVIPLKVVDVNNALRGLGVTPTPTTASTTGTSDACAMCTDTAACRLDPDADQGEDGIANAPPTGFPLLSSPSVVTLAPTKTFHCSFQSTSTANFQTSWCACQNGQNYAVNSASYGISTAESTSWSTSTCDYASAPDSHVTVMTAPNPSSIPMTEDPDPNISGVCTAYDTIHWERLAARSIATKFCKQMSKSKKVYSGSDVNTLTANHKHWNGAASDRSYPVSTSNGKGKPEGYPNVQDPLAMKIRITHDEKSCNAQQKENGCVFDFKAEKDRCMYWLLTAIESCDTTLVYDYDDSHWVRPFGIDWVPRVRVNGDGIQWEILAGPKCQQPPKKLPLGSQLKWECWGKDWIEQ